MTQIDLGSSATHIIDTPLLRTKLYVPQLHAETVHRSRLTVQLNKGLSARLTLVAAPAGFGKTTTVVQWLHETTYPVAWLSLDARDSDPATFLRYLVAALQTVSPLLGMATLALLAAPQPPGIGALLTLLLNDCAVLEHELVLVIDDYHVLHMSAVNEAVAFLVEHAPPHLHLVITTREEPPLPLMRLRARRQLVELRAADLRFTTDEAATFLHDIMHLPISATDVVALEQRIEGWIAGLHLAALAMQNRGDVTDFVRTFTGSNRFVVEYLVEEVIEQLPTPLRSFVLYTSILERFCAPLCDAVMLDAVATLQAAYSATLINQVERMHLFVIPLDDERRWYRYHHLFADVVRSRLQSSVAAETIAQLHQRASEWCERSELITEAIHYAIRGKAYDRAADLLEQYGGTLTAQFGPSELVGWIAQLPRLVLDVRPNLALIYGLALVWSDRFAEATSLLHVAEQVIAAQSGDQSNLLAHQAAALRAALALMQEEAPALVVAAGRSALEASENRDSVLRGTVSLVLGCGYALQGDDQAALQVWKESVAACRQIGDGLMEVNTVAHMGRVLTYRGQLQQAECVLRDLIQRADEPYLQGIPTRGYVYAMLAWVLYERNELDEAVQIAKEVIDVCKTWSMPRILLHAYIPLVLIEQANGEPHAAQQYMQQALHIIEHHQLKQTFIAVMAYQVRLWLREGNLARAVQWATQIEPTIQGELDPAHDVDHLTLARVMFGQGRLVEAEQLLHRLIAQCESLGRERRVIEGYVVLARVVAARRDTDGATNVLRRALTLAEPEGYVRTFVDEGAPLADLLMLLRHESSVAVLRPYIDRLLSAFGPDATQQPSAGTLTPSVTLLEPLNEREVEILRLFATGRSNQAIADRLVVARSTVKWHINNLYAKLGVGNRAEALNRAQELGLL